MTDKTFAKYKLVIDEYLVNGGNGRKAYQSVYNGTSDETAEQRFSKLSRIVKVKEYLQEQQQKISQSLQITFESQLNDLQWVKGAAKKEKRLNDFIRACEVQNKMLGLNAPEKIDHTTKGEKLEYKFPDGKSESDYIEEMQKSING